MNKRVKKQWLKALRSGEYKQTQGQLREDRGNSAGFCCLGVLCNLHAKANPEIASHETDPEYYMGESGTPPDAVLKWAGLPFETEDDRNVSVTYRGKPRSLVGLNDSENLSFKQIANVIERCL
jgi:hypothetical protein